MVICAGAMLVAPTNANSEARSAAVVAPDGARGVGTEDFVAAPHPMYKGEQVTVEEKLGAQLPLDAEFRDEAGRVVTLGAVIGGDLPTVVTFNYSDCPMLCSLQLNGLSAVIPQLAKGNPLTAKEAAIVGATDATKPVAFAIGRQFRLVTFVLEPAQSLEKSVAMREKYIALMPTALQAQARSGWTFLHAKVPADADRATGGDAAIRRVADAVGFHYIYLRDRAEWAHPAALIFSSTKGRVTRYVYGNQFQVSDLRESLLYTGIDNPATAVGFMTRCYHFDSNENNYSRAGVMTLRLGAIAFVTALISAFGVLHFARRRRQPGEIR